VVLAADIVMAVLGAVFAPTVAAITLGIVGRDSLAERLGRNAACDRARNVFVGRAADRGARVAARRPISDTVHLKVGDVVGEAKHDTVAGG
jgi:hypothetical protein